MADILFTQIKNTQIGNGTDVVRTSGRDTIGIAPGAYVSDALATAALYADHPRFVARSPGGRYFRAMAEGGLVNVELSGAVADGQTDDGWAVRDTFAYAAAIGARGVRLTQGRHRLDSIPLAESPWPYGAQPWLVIQPDHRIQDWSGTVLTHRNGGKGMSFHPDFLGGTTDLPLIADVAAGDTQLHLAPADAAQLNVGDTVLWQLGELPYDLPETLNWDIVAVTAIDAVQGLVTVDKPVPAPLALSSVTQTNKRLRRMPILRDFVLKDLTVEAENVETGIDIRGGKRITLERVGGRNLGAGLMVAQYCDGMTLTDCWQDGVVLSQASFGWAFAFAECRNVTLIRPMARSTRGLVKAEAGAEVSIIGGHFENTIVDANGQSLGTAVKVINCLGRSVVNAHDLTVTGHGNYILAEVANGQAGYDGSVSLSGTTRLRHPTMPYVIPVGTMAGKLDMEIAGVREIHDFTRMRNWKRRFVLRDNERVFAFGPPGILARASFYTSPGVTVGSGQQLSGMYVGRAGNNGANIATGSFGQLIPGREIAMKVYGGTVAGMQWNLRANNFQLLCETAANAGLNAANQFVEFDGWFAIRTDLADYAQPEADWRAAGADRDVLEALFPAYDLPPIAAGATLTIDLAIPAMQSGDFIESVRMTGGLGGLTLASVEARAGSARLVLSNATATAIDRTASDLAVSFARPQQGL